jgi:hypothetical protein
MRQKRLNTWELKCLEQLDDAKIWASLKLPLPDQNKPLPRSVYALIFRWNLLLLGAFSTLAWVTILVASGTPFKEWVLAENLVVGLGFIAILGGGLSAYMTKLYANGWNSRLENEDQ